MIQAIRVIATILIILSGFFGAAATFSLVRDIARGMDPSGVEPFLLSIIVVTFTFIPALLLNLKMLRRRVRIDDDVLDDSRKELHAMDLQISIPRWMTILNFIYALSVAAFLAYLVVETRGEIRSNNEDFIIWIVLLTAALLVFIVTLLNSFPSVSNASMKRREKLPEEF